MIKYFSLPPRTVTENNRNSLIWRLQKKIFFEEKRKSFKKKNKKVLDKWKTAWYNSWARLERYRSGHNEAVLKTVCPQGRVGSNPTLSALDRQLNIKCQSAEVPKWLKGLPWKGSRSLVAARGFKSLLLRWIFKGTEVTENVRTLKIEQYVKPWKF